MTKLSVGERLKIQKLAFHRVETMYEQKLKRLPKPPKKRLTFREQYGEPCTPWIKDAPTRVPPEVAAERERMHEHTPTIHEALLGDPPQWRSALGKRQAHG